MNETKILTTINNHINLFIHNNIVKYLYLFFFKFLYIQLQILQLPNRRILLSF